MSKESFKNFVKTHPELATEVMNHQTTWQDFYELYELYGENHQIWNNYLKKEEKEPVFQAGTTSMAEFINMLKKIDLNSVQKTVGSLQKTIGLLQDIGIGSNSKSSTSVYEPRPIYQHFDD